MAVSELSAVGAPSADLANRLNCLFGPCGLYFEESDIEGFARKLETLYPETEYVNKLMTHSWGQRVVCFYDPDGNLIEVGTPM